MKNLGNLMKQAQAMQEKMAEMQARLAEMEVEGQAGAGMVRAVVNGKGEVKRIRIEPGVVDPQDVGMLEDLVVAACNDARAKADAMSAEETQKLMGGLGLPPGLGLPGGFKLPF
ncbi:MAG: YbaB/EbfC family nucleoid-associated protein [Alphaproteobacteria bacterium]|jgi:DNA-binding YbaB/EbfC family protein|nr:YbaB/EbfC family nucleoid-associated protein [Alphaproteobacteria bacterium]MBM3626287.1 YbaB/EbfC family nucleoid-associated protein [Alphaproteobacteria bacterium]